MLELYVYSIHDFIKHTARTEQVPAHLVLLRALTFENHYHAMVKNDILTINSRWCIPILSLADTMSHLYGSVVSGV